MRFTLFDWIEIAVDVVRAGIGWLRRPSPENEYTDAIDREIRRGPAVPSRPDTPSERRRD